MKFVGVESASNLAFVQLCESLIQPTRLESSLGNSYCATGVSVGVENVAMYAWKVTLQDNIN